LYETAQARNSQTNHKYLGDILTQKPKNFKEKVLAFLTECGITKGDRHTYKNIKKVQAKELLPSNDM